jgi:hypothetical protein
MGIRKGTAVRTLKMVRTSRDRSIPVKIAVTVEFLELWGIIIIIIIIIINCANFVIGLWLLSFAHK